MDSKLKCVFDYVEDSEALADSSMGGNVSPLTALAHTHLLNSVIVILVFLC